MFSRGIKWEHWPEMGLMVLEKQANNVYSF